MKREGRTDIGDARKDDDARRADAEDEESGLKFLLQQTLTSLNFENQTF